MSLTSTIIFLTIILTSLKNVTPLNFTKQEHKAGLIFLNLAKARVSYDSHTMVYHVNISEYKKLIPTIEKGIEKTETFCKDAACIFMIEQLKGQVSYMKRDERDIEAYQQNNRKKRAINWIGSAYHWAFGLMDSDDAKEYADSINNVHNTTNRIHNIVEKQTTLLAEHIKITNGTFTKIEEQLKELEFKSEFLRIESIKTKNQMAINDMVMKLVAILKLMIMEHERISKKLINTLESPITGKITQFVSASTLSKDLKIIEHELKENQKLPINIEHENPLHIFKFTTITSSLYLNLLMIEITIPVIEREHYSAYKIIPVPTNVNDYHVLIIPSTQFVLINNKNNEYIPISTEEYSSGNFNIDGEIIIKPAENSHTDYSKNCEISILIHPEKDTITKTCDMKLLPNSNYFIPINNNDLYYTSISKPIVILEYCHKHASTSYELTSSGILRLDKDCRVNADKINIRPRNNFKTLSEEIKLLNNRTTFTTVEILLDKIATLNNTKIPTSHKTVLIRDDVDDYNRLAKEAEDLMNEAKFDDKFKEVHRRDYAHSFSTILITITLIIIAGIVIATILYKKLFSESLWGKLANHFEKSNFQIPKLFVRNVYQNTPFLPRREITPSIPEIENLN